MSFKLLTFLLLAFITIQLASSVAVVNNLRTSFQNKQNDIGLEDTHTTSQLEEKKDDSDYDNVIIVDLKGFTMNDDSNDDDDCGGEPCDGDIDDDNDYDSDDSYYDDDDYDTYLVDVDADDNTNDDFDDDDFYMNEEEDDEVDDDFGGYNSDDDTDDQGFEEKEENKDGNDLNFYDDEKGKVIDIDLAERSGIYDNYFIYDEEEELTDGDYYDDGDNDQYDSQDFDPDSILWIPIDQEIYDC